MKRARIAGFAVFWWILACAAAAGCATLDFDGAEYTATTAETLKAAWAASTIGETNESCTDCEYELRVYHVERKTYTNAGSVKALSHTFKLPKTGHYHVEVRGCRGTGEDRVCSEWATSINDANVPQVNGALKRWRIYGRPAATGPIIVE